MRRSIAIPVQALSRILDRRPVRYVVVGGAGFAVNLAAFMALARLGGLDVRLAELISRSLGGVVTFVGHRQWTFAAGAGGHHHGLSGQGFRYVVLNLVNLGVAPWVVWGCVQLLGGLLLPAKFLAEAIMVVETYLLTSLIFRARTDDAS